MNQSATPSAKIITEYSTFLAKFSSLQLSTIGENGRPESSYAPFVVDQNNNYYIYVSSLARHTGNLLNDGRAGIMLIEAEAEAENIFARKRVTFECDTEAVERETEDWREIMLLFDQLSAELMETLRSSRIFNCCDCGRNPDFSSKDLAKHIKFQVHGWTNCHM